MNVFEKYKPLIVISLCITIIGWFETRPSIIHFLDAQSPLIVFLSWYVVAGAFVYALSKILFAKHAKHQRVFAVLIMYFAANIIAYWPASDYVNVITRKEASSILLASEDGAVFSLYEALGLPIALNAIMTYIITPILLFVLAFFMMTPKAFKKTLQDVFTQEQ